MKRITWFAAVLLSISALLSAGPLWGQAGTAPTVEQDLSTEPGLGNKPEHLQWLQDAGFEMFIHWSVDSQIGSVISHSMVGASEDYLNWYIDQLPKRFNPKRWDPDEIAALAKVCGMQYVVLTAKHHSGFCLWDTKTTDFKTSQVRGSLKS